MAFLSKLSYQIQNIYIHYTVKIDWLNFYPFQKLVNMMRDSQFTQPFYPFQQLLRHGCLKSVVKLAIN
jgi:hypothetical protein